MIEKEPDLAALAELSEGLFNALEKEFDALSNNNLESIEECQRDKLTLLEAISKSWSHLPPDTPNIPNTKEDMASIRSQLKRCKEMNQRNDILLRRQIEEVKILLDSLTFQKNKVAPDVYNKLGKIVT